MKVLMLLGLIMVGLATSAVTGGGRGCIYILGRCARECEEGTHAYTTGCGFLTPEATCDQPKPVTDQRGMICDYSACYCDEPTVRDKASGKCVTLDQCPKKENEEKKPQDHPTTSPEGVTSEQGLKEIPTEKTVEGQQKSSKDIQDDKKE